MLFTATFFLAGLLSPASSALIFDLFIVFVTEGTPVFEKLIETSLKRRIRFVHYVHLVLERLKSNLLKMRISY